MIKKMMRQHPLIVTILALVIGLLGIRIPVGGNLWLMIVLRIGLSAIMLGIIVIMSDQLKEVFSTFCVGMWSSIKKCLYLLIIALLVMIFGLLKLKNVSDDYVYITISTFILCFFVGLFEESLFRGILLQGLLAKMGKTRGGIAGAAVISGLIFGFVHVLSYFLGGSYTFSGVLQAFSKIICTGIFGMLIAAVYLTYKNFWALVLIHMFNDFFTLLVVNLPNGKLTINYVDPKLIQNNITVIVTTVISIIMYLPPLIISIKMLKKIEIPQQGIFNK